MMKLFFCFSLMVIPVFAQAYIGPGSGLSAIGSILAFVGVVFLFLLGFFWYPIKRMMKSIKGKDNQEETVVSRPEENEDKNP